MGPGPQLILACFASSAKSQEKFLGPPPDPGSATEYMHTEPAIHSLYEDVSNLTGSEMAKIHWSARR